MTSTQNIGQRERAKAARRQQIIDAAEGLIRENASTNFTMRKLADRAGISHHTSYNLIGSKSAILYALLNRCLDEINAARMLNEAGGDYIDQIYLAGNAAANIFTDDPDFYQPLLRFIFGVPDPVHRPAFTIRAYDYWCKAVKRLVAGAGPAQDVSEVDLAHDFQVFFNGALEIWVHGDTTSEQFRAQIKHGLTLRLLALGDAEQRPRLAATLDALRPMINIILTQSQSCP